MKEGIDECNLSENVKNAIAHTPKMYNILSEIDLKFDWTLPR